MHPSFGAGTSGDALAHADKAAGEDREDVAGAVAQRRPRCAALAEAARDELAPLAELLGDGPSWRCRCWPATSTTSTASARSAATCSHAPMTARDGSVQSRAVHVLLATDADWLVDEVVAALGGPDVSFTVCTDGREVAKVVEEQSPPASRSTSAIFDLQIGSMGGMAVTMSLRLDESGGRLPHVPVLMLLDRIADVHLAKRSGADGWLVKPLDPLRLRRAVRAVLAGGRTTKASSTTARSSRAPPPRPRSRRRRVARRPGGSPTSCRRRRLSIRPLLGTGRPRVGSAPATGCSAAWLARHVRDVEAGSSNLPTPTRWTSPPSRG